MTRASFYTTQKIGPKRSLTPEGFLLCEEVPIARTGVMLYAAGEIDAEPGGDGIIRVVRDDKDVFRPETIVSCMGKPVVNDHPADGELVNADTWKALAVGTMMNPRRGTGIIDDLLLADLLVTDAATIRDILDKDKREVSCGYSAEYEQLEPGKARQHDIIINHVALVEKGRCGPRCAIGDHAMTTKKPNTFGSKLRTLFKGLPTADAEAAETAIREAEAAADQGGGGTVTPASQGGVTINLHTGMGAAGDAKDVADPGNPNGDPVNGAGDSEVPAWFKDFEGKLNQRLGAFDEFMKKTADAMATKAADAEDPDKDKDKAADADPDDKDKGKTADSTGLVDEFKDTKARAEILSPGITLPTFDSKAKRVATADILCKLRRTALTNAFGTVEGKEIVSKVAGGVSNFMDAKHSCDTIRGMFIGASELAKVKNNTAKGAVATTDAKPLHTTIADMNDTNKKFWATKGGVAR